MPLRQWPGAVKILAVVAGLGAAAGLLLAWWGVDLLTWLKPQALPRVSEISLDWRVLVFTASLALLTEIYAVIRTRHGPEADRDEVPGFYAPWRLIVDNRPAGFEAWLTAELKSRFGFRLLGAHLHSLAGRSETDRWFS